MRSVRRAATIAVVAAAAAGVVAQQPVIPKPAGLQPTAPPAPGATQSQTPSAATATPTPAQMGNFSPPLRDCGGALQRMNGLLLFEMIFEMLFLVLRFAVSMEYLEWELMKMAIMRAVWTFFPVVPLNFSALWWGTGPKGTCLSSYGSVRLAFTLLVFYGMFSALDTVLLILQAREEDEDSDYDSYDGSEYSRRNWGRRRRRRSSRDTTGYASQDESSDRGIFRKIGELFRR